MHKLKRFSPSLSRTSTGKVLACLEETEEGMWYHKPDVDEFISSLLEEIIEKFRDKSVRAFEHLDTEPIRGTNRNRFVTAETPEEMIRLEDAQETLSELLEENFNGTN